MPITVSTKGGRKLPAASQRRKLQIRKKLSIATSHESSIVKKSKPLHVDDGASVTESCTSFEASRPGCLKVHTQAESLRIPFTSRMSPEVFHPSVQFSTVQVRTYPTVLSDQPECTAGPPIGIGWNYDASLTTLWEVDDHKNHVNPYHHNRQSKTAKKALVLSPWIRERILRKQGYAQSALDAAAANAAKIRKHREATALDQRQFSSFMLVPLMNLFSGNFKETSKSTHVKSEKKLVSHKKDRAKRLTERLY